MSTDCVDMFCFWILRMSISVYQYTFLSNFCGGDHHEMKLSTTNIFQIFQLRNSSTTKTVSKEVF